MKTWGFRLRDDDSSPSCLPVKGFRSRVRNALRRRSRKSAAKTNFVERRVAYVPKHAGTDFLRNATSRQMREANEVL